MANALAITFPSPTGDLQGYLAGIARFPLLDESEERTLAERFRTENDLEAAWRLVTSHLRFVVKLARGYRGYGLPEEDLIQEGNVGLMKAVRRFDPSVGVRLTAFAAYWIRAEIHEFVLKNWRIVKVATTRAQRRLFFNLRSAKRHLDRLSADEIRAIADDLGVKPDEVAQMEGRLQRADLPFDGGDPDAWCPSDWLCDETSRCPETIIEDEEWRGLASEGLREALEALDPRSRDVIASRWLAERKSTLRALARKWGVSIERIRQIEAESLKNLRAELSPDYA